MKKLDPSQLAQLATDLPHWHFSPERGGLLTREFKFTDFVQAFGFMTQIALLAEKHTHHPEWSNVYNRVTLVWTTHDVQGLSTNDLTLACLCDQAFDRITPA